VTLTAKDVAEIMRLLEESSFDSLSLEINGMKLNLQRGSAAPQRQGIDPAAMPVSAPVTPSPAKPKVKPPSEPGLMDVPSPLLGVFYRAPKPGEPPFVQIGSKVEEDTMNSVRAGVKGEVVEILGENGVLVEYGETLLRVRPEV
jgi:acetyl-CoA carboxylase biotin carboxyl carrier protein